MMRPFTMEDIFFDDDVIVPELIKKPKRRKKQKGWQSYYNWRLSHQRIEIWVQLNGTNFPYQREDFINSKEEK